MTMIGLLLVVVLKVVESRRVVKPLEDVGNDRKDLLRKEVENMATNKRMVKLCVGTVDSPWRCRSLE